MWNIGTEASGILWILCICIPSFSVMFSHFANMLCWCCRQTTFMRLWQFRTLWQCDFQQGKCITMMLQQCSCVACTMATLAFKYSNFPPPLMFWTAPSTIYWCLIEEARMCDVSVWQSHGWSRVSILAHWRREKDYVGSYGIWKLWSPPNCYEYWRSFLC